MWHLVWSNILGFSRIFKDSHIWLQISPENQMPRVSEFPINSLFVRMWIPSKTGGYPNFQI